MDNNQQVDFIIIATDQQNNKKEISVSIDPNEIKQDKNIFRKAKKQNATLSVDQSGDVNIIQRNESGEVNKTETQTLNANDNKTSNNDNDTITTNLDFNNANIIKKIIETIKSDQLYQLQMLQIL